MNSHPAYNIECRGNEWPRSSQSTASRTFLRPQIDALTNLRWALAVQRFDGRAFLLFVHLRNEDNGERAFMKIGKTFDETLRMAGGVNWIARIFTEVTVGTARVQQVGVVACRGWLTTRSPTDNPIDYCERFGTSPILLQSSTARL